MASSTVKVEGARQLRATLRRAGVDLTDMKDANASVAAYVATASASAAPKVSGRLAASVRGNRAAASAVVRAGGAAVPYAGPIHWGWPKRNITANPFMSATAEATEPTWVDMYMSAVDRIVASIKGK